MKRAEGTLLICPKPPNAIQNVIPVKPDIGRTRCPQISDVPFRRRAYTLVELLTAMAIMTVVMGAATGSLMIASQAIDDRQGSTTKTLRTRDVTDRVIADLRMALAFTEQNSNAVTFTVADRDDDNNPETIRYAWSAADETITRDYNGKGPVVVASSIKALDFNYLNRTVSPPPQPCCDGPGSCDMLPPDLCAAGGGTPKDKNLTCADNPCGGACCLGDGSCVETSEFACNTVEAGTYKGDGTICADIQCPLPLKVLFFVGNATSPDDVDLDRKALWESWSYEVTLIEDNATQVEIDAAVSGKDIAYISSRASDGGIEDKLNSVPIGVLTEERHMASHMLVWSSAWNESDGTAIQVDDNTHYITSAFNTGSLTILNQQEKLLKSNTDGAPGAVSLASAASDLSRSGLAVAETGHLLDDGSRASGRRVLLPWGKEIPKSSFNEDGTALMRRAMEWAGGQGPTHPRLLFVVTSAAAPTAQESARQTLFESWGYQVVLLTSSSNQDAYDDASATALVAYLSEDLNSSDVGTKLTDASLGIVNEEVQLSDELGLSSDRLFKLRDSIEIVDNAHFITNGLSLGTLVLYDPAQPVHMLNGSLAPGLLTLGESLNTGSIYKPSLAVLEVGADLEGGGTAAGRRVELPWGGNDFDINDVNADGLLIMKRAVDWAAGRD